MATNILASDNLANRVHISKMTGKLKNVLAINTDTTSNEFCNKQYNSKDPRNICTYCYSQNMLKTFRKNCVPAFQRNSKLLSESILPVESLPVIKTAFFRYNGHGELINRNHFVNLINIARKNPGVIFGLWTKRRDIVGKYFKNCGSKIPGNLILIYSNSRLDNVKKIPPKYFHKTFNNVTPENTPEIMPGVVHCTGQKCIDCRACYTPGENTTVVEYKK